MPLCPNGVQPKPQTPAVVAIGSSLLTTLVGTNAPFLIPFLTVLEPYILNTIEICAGDPVPFPELTAGDLAALAVGFVSPKMTDVVHHAAWYAFCECKGTATPAAPYIPSPQDIPTWISGTTAPCETLHVEWDINRYGVGAEPYVIGSPTSPRPFPVGALQIRLTTKEILPGPNQDSLQTYLFTTSFKDAAGVTLAQQYHSFARYDAGSWTYSNQTVPIPATAVTYFVQARSGTGGQNAGAVISYDHEFLCGGAGQIAPECCPPDPTLVAKINRIQLAVTEILERLGVSGPLNELNATAISGEGQLNLVSGARQVNIALDQLGGDTKFVAYANPDRLMRAGTIRFGNDFGWRRREHVDNVDCLFPVPPDSTVVSWSLSPGTSGELIQLGNA